MFVANPTRRLGHKSQRKSAPMLVLVPKNATPRQGNEQRIRGTGDCNYVLSRAARRRQKQRPRTKKKHPRSRSRPNPFLRWPHRLFPVAPAWTTIGVVAADDDLRAILERNAVGTKPGHQSRRVAAPADCSYLAQTVGDRQKCFGAGKKLAAEVG